MLFGKLRMTAAAAFAWCFRRPVSGRSPGSAPDDSNGASGKAPSRGVSSGLRRATPTARPTSRNRARTGRCLSGSDPNWPGQLRDDSRHLTRGERNPLQDRPAEAPMSTRNDSRPRSWRMSASIEQLYWRLAQRHGPALGGRPRPSACQGDPQAEQAKQKVGPRGAGEC